jgi:hypothetical protein
MKDLTLKKVTNHPSVEQTKMRTHLNLLDFCRFVMIAFYFPCVAYVHAGTVFVNDDGIVDLGAFEFQNLRCGNCYYIDPVNGHDDNDGNFAAGWNYEGGFDLGDSYTLREWQAVYGHDINSIEADPLFVDPRNSDFHLKPGTPCVNMGRYASEPPPACTEPIRSDLNGDCKVDILDLEILMSEWLKCNLEPVEACYE